MDTFFFDYWLFHVPNYLMAAVMYTLIARFFLQFIVPPTWENYIWRWFRRLTDWSLVATRWITPSFVSYVLLPAVAALWLFFLRLAFVVLMTRAGLAPTIVPPT